MNTEMRISKQSTLSLVLTIGCMNKYFITSFGTIVYTVLMSFVHSQNLLFPCGFGQDAFNHTWKVTHGQKDTNLEMIRNNRKTKDNRILLHLINLQLDNNCKFKCRICFTNLAQKTQITAAFSKNRFQKEDLNIHTYFTMKWL